MRSESAPALVYPELGKGLSVRSSRLSPPGPAVFDEQDLVSSAASMAVLEMAEKTGLSRLIGEHVCRPRGGSTSVIHVVEPRRPATASSPSRPSDPLTNAAPVHMFDEVTRCRQSCAAA